MATARENEWLGKMRDIVLKHIDTERFAVFVYGSRAANTAVRSSDIDIGILGESKVPAEILARIQNEIDESDIPFHYDLVDFSRVDESFKSIALQHIIPWTQPNSPTEKYPS
jgi:predicted nucleotidyltransferase